VRLTTFFIRVNRCLLHHLREHNLVLLINCRCGNCHRGDILQNLNNWNVAKLLSNWQRCLAILLNHSIICYIKNVSANINYRGTIVQQCSLSGSSYHHTPMTSLCINVAINAHIYAYTHILCMWIDHSITTTTTTTTTTLLQPFYSPLSKTTQVSQYQKKHSPTHLSWSLSNLNSFFHLLRSIASSLFNLCVWQSFRTTLVEVVFGLCLGLEPSTSHSIHFFTRSVSSFRNTCPHHRSLFCCRTKIISPIHTLNSLLGTSSFALKGHSGAD